MRNVELTLFGSPVIARDGAPLGFDTRKVPAMLAVLAVSGRPHGRDELAALLWPGSDQTRARASLRRTLSSAGSVGPALLAGRGAIELDPALVTCDVTRFTTLRRQGGISAARAAVALYAGDFLAGFGLRDSPEFEDWRAATAEELRRDLDDLLSTLVRDHIGRGEYADALPYARRRLTLDPLREDAHQDLIRLLSWSGERTAAIRQYRDCVRILERELGVEPLPETTAVYDAVRTGQLSGPEPVTTVAASTSAEPGTSRAATPFVGRAGELGLLREAWTALPRVVAVVGETGSGKSALVERFCSEVARPVVTVRGHEGEQSLAYSAVYDLVRSALADSPAVVESLAGGERRALGRLVPAVSGEDVPVRDDGDDAAARTRLFSAVRGLLGAICSNDSVVLVVEDAHFLDEESLEVLAFLTRRLPRGLLLVLTWRASAAPQALAAAVADAGRDGRAALVRLEPFDRRDVGALLEAMGTTVTDVAVTEVLLRTGGLPLLVAEDAAILLDSADARVASTVRVRVDAAPPATTQLLAVVAVVAAPVDPDLLRRVSGRSDAEVVAGLEDAVARGLLVESATRAAYDFPHDTLRRLVLDRTSRARRRLLHGRAADALMERLSRRPGAVAAASIARQLELAGRDEEAAVWHVRAAEDARRVFAHSSAAEHLEAALALGHDPAGLHLALGECYARLGRYADAVTAFEQAAAQAPEGVAAASVERRLAQVHLRLGDLEIAEAHLGSARSMPPADRDDAWDAELLADIALVRLRRGDVDRAGEAADEAVRLATSAAEPVALAEAHNVSGLVAARTGDLTAAREHLLSSLASAELLADPRRAVAALNNLSRLEAEAGHLPAALDAAERALALGSRSGDVHPLAALHTNLADLLHATGRDEQAQEHQRAAAALFAEVDREPVRRPEIWKLAEW